VILLWYILIPAVAAPVAWLLGRQNPVLARWTALLDFDGLVGTQGRAIDAAMKIRYDLTDAWYMTAGYRVFEGGVDNDRYAFGWYNFALVSLGVRF